MKFLERSRNETVRKLEGPSRISLPEKLCAKRAFIVQFLIVHLCQKNDERFYREKNCDWDCFLIFSNVHSIRKQSLIFVFSRYMLICFISLRPLNLLQQHYYLLFTIESHKATAGNHHDEAESGHQYNWCGLLIPRFRCRRNSGSRWLVHRITSVIKYVIMMHRVFCQVHHTYCNDKPF